jgi:hypothetical protein
VRSEVRRLRTLASRMGCCPTHLTRLICAVCDFHWTGTDAECDELEPLAERVSLYLGELPTNGRCRCGTATCCLDCYEATKRPTGAPDDVLSPQELARYHWLLGHLVPTDRRAPNPQDDTSRSQGRATP